MAVEAETGVGINESINKAINMAVQAAVVQTIREGARKGHWAFREQGSALPAPEVKKDELVPPQANTPPQVPAVGTGTKVE